MKFCKDCVYFEAQTGGADLCTRRDKIIRDRVRGVEYNAGPYRDCRTERIALIFGCGKKAKYFEAK